MVVTLPQQHETNFDDPRERFLWAFRNLEFRGSPVAFPEPVLREWSEHLSKCGFVHVSQVGECPVGSNPLEYLPQQEIQFQPPVVGQDHDMNLAGQWVSMDEPIVQPQTSMLAGLTNQEKARLINELKEEGLVDYTGDQSSETDER